MWCWAHLHSQRRAAVFLDTSSSRKGSWGCVAKHYAGPHPFCCKCFHQPNPQHQRLFEGLQLPWFPSTFTWWWQQHMVTSTGRTSHWWLLAGRHHSCWPPCKQSRQDGEMLSSEFVPEGTVTASSWAADITLPIALSPTAKRNSCCWVLLQLDVSKHSMLTSSQKFDILRVEHLYIISSI